MRRAAKEKKEKEEKKVEFIQVWFIPTENLREPDKMCQRFMVKAEKEDGERCRLYHKKETVKTGFDVGFWNKNVGETKLDVLTGAMFEVQDQLEKARELVGSLEKAENLWMEEMALV